ncbi:hypothetical protein N7492_004908 [Penicillium capsulatum]|uniref:Eisosome protein 1 n=1 Tax=Penicillium capsulatum TaxID=69766 RepID=A0A9W9LRF1_9EURO|nr:hypothetical protein N7492_004908 [Penicillium capsulatum]KAJ6135984.1 hypothetical protein N7512_001144 [Penicillium capsulatum]
MATAQMPGPRSARLADDAATAALYAVHPQRKSVHDASTSDSQYLNPRSTGALDLSHASAGAALAHANRKPVEIWRPGRLTDAEKAALCVKDFTPPEIPQPSTQYSAEGLGAAILAVREQRGMSSLPPTQTGHKHDISLERSHTVDKACRAATGAYTARRRSGSAPGEAAAAEPHHARFAAEALKHGKADDEGPLDHLDSAMEASRIQHVAHTNARLYTSTPPIASEVEEQNRQSSLRAAAISMAKDMYDVTGPPGEAGEVDPAIYAAQKGQEQRRSRKTVSGAEGSTAKRALTLQDAAQKRAAEKLARMQDEHAEMQEYYGTAPQAQRSILAVRRKRTSSDADVSQVDAERSRHIRSQMTSLRTKLDQVDEKRSKDRELLMEAARRNVDATISDMETKLYADTGRAPPSMQKQWDEAARERVRQEAEAVEATGAQGARVNIGARQYVDMADVETVARSRVQPALDEISDQAEKRRAQEIEARLDAEERQRQAAIEKERETEMQALERREKGGYLHYPLGELALIGETGAEKRDSKGIKALLWRRKSKRVSTEKAQPKEEVAAPAAPSPEAPAAPAPEAPGISDQASAQEEPETAGAASVAAAAPIAAPVILQEPADYPERPSIVTSHTAPQDAAAIGPGVDAMHTIRPVTSPRADSKLKTWFRDRLVRRSSGPVRVYPNQPGPEFNTDSDVGFTGGASLTDRNEPRGAALSSHPITGADLDPNQAQRHGSVSEANRSPTDESAASQENNGGGNGNGESKRQRLRRSFLKGVSRTSPEAKSNGAGDHSRQGTEAIPESKGAELSGLRDSAYEEGLPVPPVLGESMGAGRESRFSEDL